MSRKVGDWRLIVFAVMLIMFSVQPGRVAYGASVLPVSHYDHALHTPRAPGAPPQVSVTPSPAQVPLCQTAQVAVQIADVQELYGFDIELAFDPNTIAVDQLTFGTFLDSGFTLIKQANNISGTVRYVMTQVNPSLPKSGSGVLFNLVLRGKRIAATSPLTLTSTTLAHANGGVFTATLVSGSVAVTGSTGVIPALTGVVTDTITRLPVVDAVVTLTDSQSLVYTTTVGAGGAYAFSCATGQQINSGPAQVTARAQGYDAAAGYNPAVTITNGATQKNVPLTPRSLTIYPLYFRIDSVNDMDVHLSWATLHETGTLGFDLYHNSVNDPRQAVLIDHETAKSSGAAGAVYSYTDTVPSTGVWWYWLVARGPGGAQDFDGPLFALVGFQHHVWLPAVIR
jgi:hypothetical protein